MGLGGNQTLGSVYTIIEEIGIHLWYLPYDISEKYLPELMCD